MSPAFGCVTRSLDGARDALARSRTARADSSLEHLDDSPSAMIARPARALEMHATSVARRRAARRPDARAARRRAARAAGRARCPSSVEPRSARRRNRAARGTSCTSRRRRGRSSTRYFSGRIISRNAVLAPHPVAQPAQRRGATRCAARRDLRHRFDDLRARRRAYSDVSAKLARERSGALRRVARASPSRMRCDRRAQASRRTARDSSTTASSRDRRESRGRTRGPPALAIMRRISRMRASVRRRSRSAWKLDGPK